MKQPCLICTANVIISEVVSLSKKTNHSTQTKGCLHDACYISCHTDSWVPPFSDALGHLGVLSILYNFMIHLVKK